MVPTLVYAPGVVRFPVLRRLPWQQSSVLLDADGHVHIPPQQAIVLTDLARRLLRGNPLRGSLRS